MSMGKDSLVMDLRYSEWADRRVLAACSELTVEELGRNLGNSHRSVLETLRHAYVSQDFWCGCLYENVLPPLDTIGGPEEPAEGSPEEVLEGLKREQPALWSKVIAWVEGLTEEELGVELSCRMGDGCVLRFARWQLLRHMVNHSTLHRGQVIGMLRVLGKKPPNGDLIGHYIAGQVAGRG
jgi:uncharacterized damage-inducible protein DinB